MSAADDGLAPVHQSVQAVVDQELRQQHDKQQQQQQRSQSLPPPTIAKRDDQDEHAIVGTETGYPLDDASALDDHNTAEIEVEQHQQHQQPESDPVLSTHDWHQQQQQQQQQQHHAGTDGAVEDQQVLDHVQHDLLTTDNDQHAALANGGHHVESVDPDANYEEQHQLEEGQHEEMAETEHEHHNGEQDQEQHDEHALEHDQQAGDAFEPQQEGHEMQEEEAVHPELNGETAVDAVLTDAHHLELLDLQAAVDHTNNIFAPQSNVQQAWASGSLPPLPPQGSTSYSNASNPYALPPPAHQQRQSYYDTPQAGSSNGSARYQYDAQAAVQDGIPVDAEYIASALSAAQNEEAEKEIAEANGERPKKKAKRVRAPRNPDGQQTLCRCDLLNANGEPCTAAFKRNFDLLRHKKTVHVPGEQKTTWDCAQCRASFSRRDALQRHARIRSHNSGL